MAQLGTLNQTDPGAISRSLLSGVTQQEQNNDLMTEKQIDNLYHLTHSLVGEGMSNQPTYSPLGAAGRMATTWLGLHEGQAAGRGEQASNQAQTGNLLDLFSNSLDGAGGPSAPGAQGAAPGPTSELDAPHDGEGHPALQFGKSDVTMDEAKAGIHTVESGGSRNPYTLLGPVVAKGMYKGQQAIGKYQVMPGELQDQLATAGLPSMTLQEFRNNPQAQEKLFEANFGNLLNKYGNFNDAASVWFTGRPMRKALKDGANDGYTAVGDYLAKANGGIARYRMAQAKNPANPELAYANPQGGQPGNPLSGPVNNPVQPQPGTGLTPDNLTLRAPPPPMAPAPGTVPPLSPQTVTAANRPPAANVRQRFGTMAPPTNAQAAAPAGPQLASAGGLPPAPRQEPFNPVPTAQAGVLPQQGVPGAGGGGATMPRPVPTAPGGPPSPTMIPGAQTSPGNAPTPPTARPQVSVPPQQLDTSRASSEPTHTPEGWEPRFAPGIVNPKDPKARASIMALSRLNPAKAQEILTPQVIDGDDGWKWTGNQWIGWTRTQFPVLPKTQEVSVGVGPLAGHALRQLTGGPPVTMSGVETGAQPTNLGGDGSKPNTGLVNKKGYPVRTDGSVDQSRLTLWQAQGWKPQ